MLRFLLRRLLLAVPTLFGISLITFALVHLAPGDPLAASDEGTARGASRDRESTRRLYFLDLPLFFNARPRGLEARTARLLQDLATGGEPAVRRAQRCGSLCLPDLAAERASSSGVLRSSLDRALELIRGDHPSLVAGAGSLDVWIERALPLLRDEALAALASRLGADVEAAAQMQRRGIAALPSAMNVLLEGEGAARSAASDVVSALSGIEGRVRVGDPGARRVVASWSEWWYQHRREHVRFSRWDRVAGLLGETQFAKWIGRLVTLRFGTSIRDGRPVTEKVGEALPVTLVLSLLAMALAYLVAIPLGVHAAVRRGSLLERVTTVLLFVLYSLPSFWLAMVLILLFGGVGYLDWFPIYGLSTPGLESATGGSWLVDRLHHLVLPVICLSYGSLAVISRYQRSAMLDVIRQDYIRTARAKGLSERTVIFKHALRNALLPTITLLGLQLPYLIGGSVIIERIFNIPGMGLLTFQAFLHRDYPVIMAVSVLSATLTLFGLILADVFYAVADPRITLEGRR
jgi:peptide/nickel transport system permease protein